MYFLQIECKLSEVDLLSADLWQAGTVGVSEVEDDEHVTLQAAFESNQQREHLLKQFAAFSPSWQHTADIDWVKATQQAWPSRMIGEQLFLAPLWSDDPTPLGRLRVIHNPGSACGTGEHPCTQLALMALEHVPLAGSRVVDIGTGSGILLAGALKLGADNAVGLDVDQSVIPAALETLQLNGLPAWLLAGSADCLCDGCGDVVVANINATVLLFIEEELRRVRAANGYLIVTGFPEAELPAVAELFRPTKVLLLEGWACVISHAS